MNKYTMGYDTYFCYTKKKFIILDNCEMVRRVGTRYNKNEERSVLVR